VLPSTASLPAAGQGAMGIETLACRADLQAWLRPLNDDATAACITAERAVSSALGGSCSVPLAAYGVLEGALIVLRAKVGAPDGSVMLETEVTGGAGDAEALGQRAAMELRKQGADKILAALKDQA
jgi:hydroxymethylbilane synthase